MSELYDIFFSAQLIDDFDEGTVRKNIAQLFKANEATLEKLFSGKPQLIKSGVDKPAALKYKAALQKAGAVARVRKHVPAGDQAPAPKAAAPKPAAKPAAKAAAKPVPKPAPEIPMEEDLPSSGDITPAAATASVGKGADVKSEEARDAALANQPDAVTFGEEISVAPAGSDLLQDGELEQPEVLEVDTSSIELAAPFDEFEIIEVEVPPAPDTSHLSMGEVGEDIPHLESTEETVNPDTSHLSMGEVGEDIPNLEPDVELLDPDTSGIDLAPEGSDMLEEKDRHKDEAEAPNTDHLSLKD
jgi:hypothetical protein